MILGNLYIKGNIGWFKWICDLDHRLLEMGILMDWLDINDNSDRPNWIQQVVFVPCCCKMYFFCKNHLTGRYGPPKKPRVASENTPGSRQSSVSSFVSTLGYHTSSLVSTPIFHTSTLRPRLSTPMCWRE